MNTDDIIKMIYIPTGIEPGMKRHHPVIIYIFQKIIIDDRIECMGNKNYEELISGRYSFYPYSRCYPFSHSVWNACLKHANQEYQLNIDYENIVKGARRKDKKFPDNLL